MFERRKTYVDQRTLLPSHSRERFSAVPDTSGESAASRRMPCRLQPMLINCKHLREASTRTRRLPKRPRPLTTSEDDDLVEGEGLDDTGKEDIDGDDDTCRETSTRSSGGAELDAKRNKGKTSTVHDHFALIQKKVNRKMLTAAQQVTLNMLFLKLLIMVGLPFRLDENPHLLEMLQFLNNSSSLWSRFTYRNVSLDVFSTMRSAVKNM
ncbi:hypothetical protein PsorP6_000269 [Peronosclerospora sorghi]|uniref:Uncharacterized protein n=1 Tax=Peronosclerospora sorghi TaxID=230839 RepID=A0ACC0WRE7_9STRA|nr:hypothetical protein PsorP6_000269 [Peronosclerospora sorghi]